MGGSVKMYYPVNPNDRIDSENHQQEMKQWKERLMETSQWRDWTVARPISASLRAWQVDIICLPSLLTKIKTETQAKYFELTSILQAV